MDPLTIASTIAAVIANCTKVSLGLRAIVLKYTAAEAVVLAISNECSAISAALMRIHSVILKKDSESNSENAGEVEMKGELAVLVNDCQDVLKDLMDEVERISKDNSEGIKLGWADKAKYLWNEERMATILSRLRSQLPSLGLFLQVLQM
jgi:hypothetical protein